METILIFLTKSAEKGCLWTTDVIQKKLTSPSNY